MNKKMNNKGFSLVELIIVIAIMAILVGVLAPQFIKYIESSRQSTDISAASEYKSAVEAYVADNGDTAPALITVTMSNAGIYASIDLSDVGLATNSSDLSSFKSNGWQAATATYNTSTFKWNSNASGNSINTKDPNKDISVAFE